MPAVTVENIPSRCPACRNPAGCRDAPRALGHDSAERLRRFLHLTDLIQKLLTSCILRYAPY